MVVKQTDLSGRKNTGRWFAAVVMAFLLLFSFGISRANDLRELRIVVYTQCKVSAGKKADIAQQFERVSQSMQDKAGIRLKIVGWEERCFPVAQSAGMVMAQMKAELGLGDQYDVAVAFTGMTPWGYAANLLSLPSSLGATDTEYFRFIVIREQWDSVLEHELWHVFLHGHSEGLNAPVFMKLPFGPPVVSNYLSPESLSTIQKNKWRTFYGEDHARKGDSRSGTLTERGRVPRERSGPGPRDVGSETSYECC